MLRGVVAAPPSPESDAEAGTRRPGAPSAPASRQPQVHEVQQQQQQQQQQKQKTSTPNYARHQRQQSAPSFPTRRPTTPSRPPPRDHSSTRRQSQGMGLTGDKRGRNSPLRPGGQPTRPSTPSVEINNGTASVSVSHPHQARTPLDTTPKSATQSRFGFFASSVSALTSRMTSPMLPPALSDEDLCDLDIEAALTPLSPPLGGPSGGPGGPGGPGGGDAYKSLQTNATSLLHQMQDAYRRQAATMREMQAEQEAQREETEEMELRSTSYKSQLERMAATAAQQEEAMQKLVAELRAERRARLEERVGRERDKIMMMCPPVAEEGSLSPPPGCEDILCGGSGSSSVDGDVRKRWRTSNSTFKSELSVDTDGDGDDSAESESIFSRSRSPTAMTCVTENESLDVPSAGHHLRVAVQMPKPVAAKPQLTAFQRLVKGMSATKEESGGAGGAGLATGAACRNCRGQDASVAWDTVSLLRDENIALKQRVAHLEDAVEGALDVVNGIKI
ncbi:hypothetical protein GGR50DRAFT_33423 [Xylaria sp. CBS 124048]|nr:hypothetical protein GGR50DRAFT_33423 [Xylaria sp. CBS 124048]